MYILMLTNLYFRTHNLWFRCALVLEQLASEHRLDSMGHKSIVGANYQPDPIATRRQEVSSCFNVHVIERAILVSCIKETDL